MLWGSSFLKVGLEMEEKTPCYGLKQRIISVPPCGSHVTAVLPVVLLNVSDELIFSVRPAGNGHSLLHEGLVQVHLVQLQLQLLGDLTARDR